MKVKQSFRKFAQILYLFWFLKHSKRLLDITKLLDFLTLYKIGQLTHLCTNFVLVISILIFSKMNDGSWFSPCMSCATKSVYTRIKVIRKTNKATLGKSFANIRGLHRVWDIWVISPSHSKNLLTLVEIQIFEPLWQVLPKELHFGFLPFINISPPLRWFSCYNKIAKQNFIERFLKLPWNFLWNFLETHLTLSLTPLNLPFLKLPSNTH